MAFAILACTILLSAASSLEQQPAATYLQKSRTFHSPAEFARITARRRAHADSASTPADELRIRRLPVHLPVNDFTVIADESPTTTWIGSAQGAVRLNTATRTVEYFAGERWLPDDHVNGFGFENGATWMETAKGFSRIAYDPMTLEEKSRRVRRSNSSASQSMGLHRNLRPAGSR